MSSRIISKDVGQRINDKVFAQWLVQRKQFLADALYIVDCVVELYGEQQPHVACDIVDDIEFDLTGKRGALAKAL